MELLTVTRATLGTELNMPGRTGARRWATQPINYRCTFFMCVVYSWYLSCTLYALCAPP